MTMHKKSEKSRSSVPTSGFSKRQQHSVSFGVVLVREFERIVGDNPCVSDLGPPLSIGWRFYEDGVESPVDSFQLTHGPVFSSFKRNKIQPLKGETRRFILEDYFDVPRREIRAALVDVAHTKRQRIESMDDIEKLGGKFQGMLKSATNGMRKKSGRKSRSPIRRFCH